MNINCTFRVMKVTETEKYNFEVQFQKEIEVKDYKHFIDEMLKYNYHVDMLNERNDENKVFYELTVQPHIEKDSTYRLRKRLFSAYEYKFHKKYKDSISYFN